jgi:hypothetical protein
MMVGPYLKGKSRVGKVLRVDAGLWSGTPIVKIRWVRCKNPVQTTAAPKIVGCSNIKKAKNIRYKLKPKDVGSFITARVTAINDFGKTFVTVGTSRKVRAR